MTHYEYKEKLSALLDGELSDAERETVLAHLDACADCRAYFAELNALHAALGEMEEYDAPEGFAEGVMERLHAEEAKKVSDFRAAARSRRPWRTWGTLAACAAVVVLAVTALPNAMRMGSAGPKSAESIASESLLQSAPAAQAPMAPPAPGDAPFTGSADGVPEGGTEETAYDGVDTYAASSYGGADGAVMDEKLRAAGDAGAPAEYAMDGESDAPMTAYIVTAPEPETDAEAEEPPVLTLSGEGAAEWLAENGWQGESGDWYVAAGTLSQLPEGLELEGIAPPDDSGAVRIRLSEETEALP